MTLTTRFLTISASLIFFGSIAAHGATANIQVQYGSMNASYITQNQTELTFHHAPRTDEAVLSGMHALHLDGTTIDWLNSRLYEQTAPDQLKKRVLAMLIDQYDMADNQTKYTLQGLIQFIRRSQFGTRILTPLDPDITRLNKRDNPRLKGQWLITLKSNAHKKTVTIMGNVFNQGIYQWQSRKDARFYLTDTDNMARVSSLNPVVTVIQPDGVEQRHSVKQWDNEDFQEVAPGAIIYIPFPIIASSSHPENTAEDPNQLIIQLLRSRIQ